MRAIRASGSVRDTHSSFDSLLPLRFRSKRMRSSAVGVAIPLSWAIRGTVRIPSTSSHIGPDQHSPWFLERAIGMKIVVERAGVHIAQFAADLWNAPGLVGHQILGIAQSLGGHDPWPAATAPAGAGGGQAFLNTLPDQISLHLGKGGLDLQEGTAGRRRRIHRRVERLEGDAPLLKILDQTDQIPRPAPEPVEVQHHQHIAGPQMVETGDQAGPIGLDASHTVVEDPFTAGSLESIELAIQELAILSSRDPGVADRRHGALPPVVTRTGIDPLIGLDAPPSSEKPYCPAFYRQ